MLEVLTKCCAVTQFGQLEPPVSDTRTEPESALIFGRGTGIGFQNHIQFWNQRHPKLDPVLNPKPGFLESIWEKWSGTGGLSTSFRPGYPELEPGLIHCWAVLSFFKEPALSAGQKYWTLMRPR
jgi:hypothetical protein